MTICQKSRQPNFWEVMDCFISICKFSSFKNLFATITSLSELYFIFRRFILLVQMKKVFLVYASLAASTTLSQQSLGYLNFSLVSKDLFCWYRRKKWFLQIMATAKAAENHGDEWGLTWYLRWGIYTSIPTWTQSQNSLVAAEIQSLKISSHVTSCKWWWRQSQSPQEES